MKGKDGINQMKTARRFIVACMAAVLMFGLGGCGGGGGGSTAPTINLGGTGTASAVLPGSGSSSVTAHTVGTTVCAECHQTFPPSNNYIVGDAFDSNPSSVTYFDPAAGATVYTNYINSVHFTPPGSTSTDYVTCEGCHGAGSQHYGVGPIPFYAPGIAQCETCHSGNGPAMAAASVIDLPAFEATAHANQGDNPDEYFGQGATGITQAAYFGQPEWADANGTVPVTKNQAIQECSVCHSPDTSSTHIAKGDVPNPPQVTCAACHDPHRPADTVRNFVPTRTGTDAMVAATEDFNLKPVQINDNPLGSQYGATNKINGTWIRPRLAFAYHVGGVASDSFSGYANQGTTGDWLRLSPERLCASCHTQGQNEFGVRAGSTAITSTHNNDVYTEWRSSGHADYNDTPFVTFSLLSTDFTASSHRPQWPYDMGGKPGQAPTAIDGRINGGANNYQCYQCHNGVGAIDYINGVQGGTAIGDTSNAHIIWGDADVMCITCHDPHKSGSATDTNVRTPVYDSYDSEFTPANTAGGTGNVRGGVAGLFMDLTPVPQTIGNNIICVFCHQGRESGWTAWNKVRRDRIAQGDTATNAANFWYNNPTTVIDPKGFGFVNDHYLADGALLYSANADEFPGKQYSDGIPAHQTMGCIDCHMGNPDANNGIATHTFAPVIQTCQTCHGNITDYKQVPAEADYDGNGVVDTAYNEIGVVTPIPSAANGGPGHASPLYGTGKGGSGLLGLLNEALWDAGIEFDPATYPYFFQANQAHTNAFAYTAFTPNTLAACQNFEQMYFDGPGGAQVAYAHNAFYAAQILIDSLNALGHTSGTKEAFQRPTVPASGGTEHTARDYRTLSVP